MGDLTIGQLAQRVGVNLETIRYYERRGLIPRPPRNRSGYRQYSRDDVTRTRFIKRAQALGFSLAEVSELLSLRRDPGMSCKDVKDRVDAKIKEIEDRMTTLEYVKQALLGLSRKCAGKGPAGECPFLKELEAVDMELE